MFGLSTAGDIERFRVGPGSVTALRVFGGDRIDVIDAHGRQPVELTVLAADPRALAEVRPDADTTVLCGLLPGADENGYAAGRILSLLSRHRIEQHNARATRLFDEHSAAGSRAGFAVDGDAVVLVAAPAWAMSLSGPDPNPPSEVFVEVRRADPHRPELRDLPEPLAEPLWDMRIDAATASSYELREGQFVQIIDVQGRQCSDFLAFDAHALGDGHEYGLDATTTRTIGGGAYPQPGLSGRFFDGRARPLVEVVRDTVGRHDTFALACTAKYYADMGYPGHVNCTDNFNATLSRFGVAPRQGWPALNLFYNTAFDAQH
ncbi:DUF1989 domain-containing protein [Mycolicibacterium xanthum]|uniref:DUF1989 domain-containing protein n=1 Tax=Mycolicibacterium xanthum TaxID=2796469 RepID=UPI00210848D7|nr:urea carboxylase-associated family protein [Mycolicibacterium xanthum]